MDALKRVDVDSSKAAKCEARITNTSGVQADCCRHQRRAEVAHAYKWGEGQSSVIISRLQRVITTSSTLCPVTSRPIHVLSPVWLTVSFFQKAKAGTDCHYQFQCYTITVLVFPGPFSLRGKGLGKNAQADMSPTVGRAGMRSSLAQQWLRRVLGSLAARWVLGFESARSPPPR